MNLQISTWFEADKPCLCHICAWNSEMRQSYVYDGISCCDDFIIIMNVWGSKCFQNFACLQTRYITFVNFSWKASLIARFMGPIWGRQDPCGPHVGPMNFAIWDITQTGNIHILRVYIRLCCIFLSLCFQMFCLFSCFFLSVCEFVCLLVYLFVSLSIAKSYSHTNEN